MGRELRRIGKTHDKRSGVMERWAMTCIVERTAMLRVGLWRHRLIQFAIVSGIHIKRSLLIKSRSQWLVASLEAAVNRRPSMSRGLKREVHSPRESKWQTLNFLIKLAQHSLQPYFTLAASKLSFLFLRDSHILWRCARAFTLAYLSLQFLPLSISALLRCLVSCSSTRCL
jgi:hypothetical protein